LAILTNGTLITPEIAQKLRYYGIGADVSIDGDEKTHNAQRVYRSNNSGSFKDAVRGFHLLQRMGGNPGVSCTIGKHNMHQLQKVARFLVFELGIKSMGFNLMSFSLKDEAWRADSDSMSAALIDAYSFLKKQNVYEDRIGRHLTPEGDLKPYFHECSGCGDQLVFLPNGDVGPCQAFLPSRKYFYANILNPPAGVLEHSVLKLWKKRSALNIKECERCPAVFICGGGCAQQAYFQNRSLFSPDRRYCNFYVKHFIPWYIEDRYMNNRKGGASGK
jgi:uncharacterized protein